MEVTKTRVDGVLLIKPKVFGDERGYFVETYQKERYSEIGITHTFVQDNHSMSRRGILRGLHYQTKHPQGKLVMVSLGAVFDVTFVWTLLHLVNGLVRYCLKKISINFGFRLGWLMVFWF